MDNRSKKRTRAAVWLCVGMLLLCVLALARYLLPALQNQAEQTLDGSAMGMMLIEIPDPDSASFYHVETLGVYVLAVDEKSQAYRLGVRSGDRIVSLNGTEVTSSSQLTETQKDSPNGKIQLVFSREDESSFQIALMHQSEE